MATSDLFVVANLVVDFNKKRFVNGLSSGLFPLLGMHGLLKSFIFANLSCFRDLKWLFMAESILHFPSTLELVRMLRATVVRHHPVGPMMCLDMTGHATTDRK